MNKNKNKIDSFLYYKIQSITTMSFIQLSANQEHYKLCLLEYLIQKGGEGKSTIESTISHYIDALITTDFQLADLHFKSIQSAFQKKEKEELFHPIIDICKSIAWQTELQIKLNVDATIVDCFK